MRKQPDGWELQKIAAVTEAALTLNPEDPAANYKTAMIKNARAIAERQATTGKTPEQAERDALESLLGVSGLLPDLNRLLAQAIRAGEPPTGSYALLLETNRRELAESNPRYLAKADGKS